jgi:hypothetical protein
MDPHSMPESPASLCGRNTVRTLRLVSTGLNNLTGRWEVKEPEEAESVDDGICVEGSPEASNFFFHHGRAHFGYPPMPCNLMEAHFRAGGH